MAVVAACCTGFMQWGDVKLHHRVRPLLADELRRRLRLRASTDPMSFEEWRDMVLVAICVVFYNPAFFPMAQTEHEFEELALTLPTSGSADGKAKVFLFNEEIDVKTLLQPVTLERLAVLREELKAQEAADEKKNQAEEGEGSDTGALKGEESEPETEDEEGKVPAVADTVADPTKKIESAVSNRN